MVGKIEDVLPHVGIFRQNLRLHPLAVEQVRRPELHPVLNQPLVGFQHFCPKVNVDEQHGHEQPNDEKCQDFEHGRFEIFAKIQDRQDSLSGEEEFVLF